MRAQAANLRATLVDKKREFSVARESVKRKRESAALLKAARTKAEKDATAESLLQREKAGLSAAHRAMDENIDRVVAVQDSLRSQGDRIRGASTRLLEMGQNIPGINTLITAATRKKTRDNMIVAASVAVGLCMTLLFIL